MVMVSGAKEFALFPPESTAQLYYERVLEVSDTWRPSAEHADLRFSETSGHGLVDVTAPDLRRHPEYKRAEGLRCRIEAGEALFVPALWHHAVHSPKGKARKPNVGVSFWHAQPSLVPTDWRVGAQML